MLIIEILFIKRSMEMSDDINSLLSEIDHYRLNFVRKSFKEDGTFADSADPKLTLQTLDNLSKSYSRRSKQASEDDTARGMEAYRERALAIAQAVVDSNGSYHSTTMHELELPDLPDQPFSGDNLALGIVKLSVGDFKDDV
jgi:hypothetical protein